MHQTTVLLLLLFLCSSQLLSYAECETEMDLDYESCDLIDLSDEVLSVEYHSSSLITIFI